MNPNEEYGHGPRHSYDLSYLMDLHRSRITLGTTYAQLAVSFPNAPRHVLPGDIAKALSVTTALYDVGMMWSDPDGTVTGLPRERPKNFHGTLSPRWTPRLQHGNLAVTRINYGSPLAMDFLGLAMSLEWLPQGLIVNGVYDGIKMGAEHFKKKGKKGASSQSKDSFSYDGYGMSFSIPPGAELDVFTPDGFELHLSYPEPLSEAHMAVVPTDDDFPDPAPAL